MISLNANLLDDLSRESTERGNRVLDLKLELQIKDAEIKRLQDRIESLEEELDLADTAVDYYQRRDW